MKIFLQVYQYDDIARNFVENLNIVLGVKDSKGKTVPDLISIYENSSQNELHTKHESGIDIRQQTSEIEIKLCTFQFEPSQYNKSMQCTGHITHCKE